MHNPKATDTAKIPVDMPKFEWAAMRDSELMSLHTAATMGNTGSSKASPTIITSGSTGYDGTTDPGAPGDPV